MRKLMWFSLGFSASCAACAYLLNQNFLWLAAAGFALAAVFLFLRKKLLFYIALGLCLGSGWYAFYDRYMLAPLQNLPEEICCRVTVADYPEYTEKETRAEVRLPWQGRSYRTQVTLNGRTDLKPGDRLEGTFRIRSRLREPSAAGRGRYLSAWSRGTVQKIPCDKVPVRFFAAKLRKEAENLIGTLFPEDSAGFAEALLLGDVSRLAYKDDLALRYSGLRHIAAVSGLHVSILCGLLMALMGKRRIPSALICPPLLLIFMSLSGYSPSAVRAGLMVLLYLGALLFKREYDSLTALSAAALMMLVVRPDVICSVSFQLSFCCVLSILLLAPVLSKKAEPVWKEQKNRLAGSVLHWAAGTLSVSIAAGLGAMPLCALYFGSVSLIGPLTNLLTLWAVPVIFCGILLSCGLGILWLPAGKLAGKIAAVLIRYVLGTARLLSRFPLASVFTASDGIAVWVILTAVLTVLYLIRRKNGWILTAVSAGVLVLAVGCSWLLPLRDQLRMTALDVGQGQCILLQSGGRNYLVDCGGSSDRKSGELAAQTLYSQGIFRLDGLILSHWDRDHVGGVPYLLAHLPADRIYVNTENPTLPDLPECVTVQNVTRLSWSNAQMTLIPGEHGSSGNDSCICVLFQAADCDILITGDRSEAGELQLLSRTEIPDLEILAVGHHGSGSSSGKQFLEAVRPDCAVISVGKHNRYGHPDDAAVKRLEEAGCRIFRTDRDGTILFRR